MSAAREYRRHVLRMGEASLAREQRKHTRESLGPFVFGSLASLVVLVILIATFLR
ncbi:MAG: hypothetical protein ACLQGP_41455 [Isosphaeraceae bacterium]